MRKISKFSKNKPEEDVEEFSKYISLYRMLKINKKDENLKKKRKKTNKIEYTYYVNEVGYSLENNWKNDFKLHFELNLNNFKILYQLKDFIRNKRKKKKNMPVLKSHLNPAKLKTIIFDLDETLIHSNFDNNGKKYIFNNNGFSFDIYINIRPYVKNLLEYLYKKYELILFTASEKNYADFVLNLIDPENKYFSYRFYRDDCIFFSSDILIKDLNFINRCYKNIVLVDNSCLSFGNFLRNSIPITNFIDNKNDRELKKLKKFWDWTFKNDDVRIFLNKYFKFKKYNNYTDIDECFNGLYKININ